MPRPLAGLLVLLATLGSLLVPAAAQAHSLESSTISTHVTDEGVDATVTVALATLGEAVGEDLGNQDVTAYAEQVDAYLANHLSATGSDGTAWGESFSGAAVETVEGIASYTVDVTFDTGDSSLSGFELTYDAVIEAVDGHEAVVVLTDAAGEVSTAGVITAADDSLTIGSGGAAEPSTGALDMVGYGFHHVLEGADHLLFLLCLLLTAPVVAVAGRWRRRTEVRPTVRSVLGVVSAFTLGHSVTLIASALGWVSLPTRLVEVLVAVSVGVAAVHAVRPLVPHGESWIAAGFGLVHGLAFAGILVELGLSGTTSIVALLAFNVGVELAQLTATALLFPSLYLLARTPAYGALRAGGASLALAAATGWVLDRLSVLANPFQGVEDAAIAHPWLVVGALAALALTATAAPRVRRLASGHSPQAALILVTPRNDPARITAGSAQNPADVR